ncbi:MAG: helix-turn-helix transcriptional regulator [Rhodospirillales bacterium]|nr:helix-turn-helix transcriptional regulator [Acetobacter sp.]
MDLTIYGLCCSWQKMGELILFLTFSIMAREPFQEALQRIERASRKVTDPASYLQGRTMARPLLPTNILCFVRRSADDLSMRLRPRAQHHRFVLIAALKGSGRLCIDTENLLLRSGHAQLIFPFQFHSYLSVAPARINWIFLTFEAENVSDLEPLRSAPLRRLGRNELALLTEIIRGWNSPSLQRFLSYQLAMLLTHLSADKAVTRSGRKERNDLPRNDVLSEINRHVMAHLDQPMTLKAVATRLGQSESHLRRRFRLATGYSMGHYLRELRLQRACRLLCETSLGVGEVAASCGFDSIYSFSRAFKQGLDLSPRAYRLAVSQVGRDGKL